MELRNEKEKVRLAILGATGGTGRALVRRALEAGHRVLAPARRPDALSALRIDLHDPAALTAGLEGADAVISAFGGRRNARDDESTRFAGVLVEAMRRAEVRRAVVVSAAFLFENEAMPRLVGRLFFPKVTADVGRAEGVYRASDLDWTLVRPPRLTNGPPTGRPRGRIDGLPPGGFSISREDLAAFLLFDALRTENVGRTLGAAR